MRSIGFEGFAGSAAERGAFAGASGEAGVCRDSEPSWGALTNRNGLARTSNTPGRTQELIFFSADDPVTLVDMPGYGYAAAPKAKVAKVLP